MTRLALALLLVAAACPPAPPRAPAGRPGGRATAAAPPTTTTTTTTAPPPTTTTAAHAPTAEASRSASRAHRPAPSTGPAGAGAALLDRIGWCESRDDYRARNPRSTASGRWQVLDSTWGGYGGYARAYEAPPAVQEAQARELLGRSGTAPWAATRGCWS